MGRKNGIMGDGSNFDCRFIPDYDELKKKVDSLRELGYKIVLTQGVYDLIHEAHYAYLEHARSFGDVLIVGVDSDELTKKRKGPNRPIVLEKERLLLLVHVRHVDIVTLRHAHDKLEYLVEFIHPDVLVLSTSTGDISKEDHAYLEGHCGDLKVLKAKAAPEETSSTARIRRIILQGLADAEESIRGKIAEIFAELRNKAGS